MSLRRDVMAMEDAGARSTAIFTDFGVVTTGPKNGPALTRTMISRMAEARPDAIVFELGDGIMGAYGVEAIEPAVVTGRATDNEVGVKIIRDRMGVPAFNALTQESELGEHLRGVLFGSEAAS